MKRLNERGRHIRFAVISVVVVAALLVGAAASASPALPGKGEPAAGAFAPQWDDGGAWEVGAEAAGGSLWQYACSEATYLRDRLVSRGWVSRYLWCGGNAWEEDFKKASRGGNEQNYLDTVDLAFYVGHGSTGSFTFDSNVDDHDLTPADCNRAWGDGDNEWVGLTSCQVLSNPNLANWAACMYGNHLILGFVSNAAAKMGTATQGYNWAYYITNNWTVFGAWNKACDISNGAGRMVRTLANELACYDDRPWSGIVCADSFDTDAWFWDHACGSEQPQAMDTSMIAEMPVYSTPPLSLDEAEQKFTGLGDTFNLPAVPPASANAVTTETDLWSVQQNDKELEMEANSGLYTYYDMNLWSSQTARAALATRVASTSAQDAKAIADKFLADNNLMPSDAVFYEVTTDTLSSTSALNGAESVQATDTVYQVIYSRKLSSTYVNKAGAAVLEDFLVVGPGAKLKVYVPMNPPATAAGAPAALTVSGVQGGWRAVEAPATGVSPTAVMMVPIISVDQAKMAYQQVPTFVLLNTPPIDATSSTILANGVAYWEEGASNIQSALFPVYSLNVEYFQGQTSLGTDYAYMPANPGFMRPYAEILSGPTAPVKVGQEVTLTAADATKTLTALGYDQSLNFTLGSGEYLYEWFVDTISDANRLGGGATPSVTFNVRSSSAIKDGKYKQTIILRVTDTGSPDLRSSVANYALDIYPRVLLPSTSK
jgi:hypothetical protein